MIYLIYCFSHVLSRFWNISIFNTFFCIWNFEIWFYLFVFFIVWRHDVEFSFVCEIFDFEFVSFRWDFEFFLLYYFYEILISIFCFIVRNLDFDLWHLMKILISNTLIKILFFVTCEIEINVSKQSDFFWIWKFFVVRWCFD